jgi:hypothetical protein
MRPRSTNLLSFGNDYFNHGFIVLFLTYFLIEDDLALMRDYCFNFRLDLRFNKKSYKRFYNGTKGPRQGNYCTFV